MKEIEALEIMDMLYAFYPNFNKNNVSTFNDIWMQRLQEGDYEKTFQKAKKYTADSPYPPSLADVFVAIHKPANTVDFDEAAARAVVEQEKADPELNARREATIKKMEARLKEMKELNQFDE